MVTASDMRMHRVLIIFTLTFTQGHTDRNHENNKCLIISDTIQAMSIKFGVISICVTLSEIVRLKVYMTIGSPMTLTFIRGHNKVRLKRLHYVLTACNISDYM